MDTGDRARNSDRAYPPKLNPFFQRKAVETRYRVEADGALRLGRADVFAMDEWGSCQLRLTQLCLPAQSRHSVAVRRLAPKLGIVASPQRKPVLVANGSGRVIRAGAKAVTLKFTRRAKSGSGEPAVSGCRSRPRLAPGGGSSSVKRTVTLSAPAGVSSRYWPRAFR